jgi:hypothetical protein
MSYPVLDSRIIAAILEGRNPIYSRPVVEEADRIADLTGSQGFRVIDRRLQALRKAGKIRFQFGADRGWKIAP